MSAKNNPQNAIVFAKMPDNTPGTVTANSWTNFLRSLPDTLAKPGDKMRLHENLWQIPLHTGLPILAKLVHQAEANDIPLHVLFLAETPDWIVCESGTKPAA